MKINKNGITKICIANLMVLRCNYTTFAMKNLLICDAFYKRLQCKFNHPKILVILKEIVLKYFSLLVYPYHFSLHNKNDPQIRITQLSVIQD